MPFESVTDDKIKKLLVCMKIISNPQARTVIKAGHEQVNYKVESIKEPKIRFEIFKRQNIREGMEVDFSCGLSWLAPNGEKLTLIRYNGSSHSHPNRLEKNKIEYKCHIHKATERYIRENLKAEGYAEVTRRYKTLDGAFHCLVMDCNVSGIKTESDDINQNQLNI